MTIHDITYLSIVGLGLLSLVVYYLMLGKAVEKLPVEWKKSLLSKKFRISILFLTIYLLLVFTGETICIYLANHGIYNSYVMNINQTLFIPFLLGFLFIHTQTVWKRYCYFILYLVLVIHLVFGGHYHPRSVMSSTTVILFFSINFLGALIHLTDLLMNPKSEYFKFQLKVNLCILISSLLSVILTSFHASNIEFGFLPDPNNLFYIHFYNIALYYFSLDLIFINEIRKLQRS